MFLILELFSDFHFWIIQFSDYKQYVDAGINNLVSISDGLGPSIFCRKMENAQPTREEMDWKLFISSQSRHCHIDSVIYKSTFPYLYLDLACKKLCFPPGKGKDRRNESTRHKFQIRNCVNNLEY